MKIKKLNTKGFSHSLILVAFVVVFAIAGVGYIVATHASPSQRSARVKIHNSSNTYLGIGISGCGHEKYFRLHKHQTSSTYNCGVGTKKISVTWTFVGGATGSSSNYYIPAGKTWQIDVGE